MDKAATSEAATSEAAAMDKAAFLRESGARYGYGRLVDAMRAAEFPQLSGAAGARFGGRDRS